MFSIKSVLESLRGSLSSMEEDFAQMEETFSSFDMEVEEMEKNGTVTVQKTTSPDGAITVTKTYTKAATKPKEEAKPETSPSAGRLEAHLWHQIYSKVGKFWPSRATLLAFDGKHYSVGILDVESRKFDIKGVGTSIADAVKDAERKYTVVR